MTDTVPQFKKFVSEDEIEEKRKQRQEEWEKVRQPDDPEEAPEEVVDNRSLYARLQEQKQKDQDEFDDKFKLKNQVKTLDKDEAEFLDYVSDRQVELEQQRDQEDMEVIREYKDKLMNQEAPVVTMANKMDLKPTRTPIGASHNKSQLSLLAGAVKRKSMVKNGTEEKKMKVENSVSQNGIKHKNGDAENGSGDSCPDKASKKGSSISKNAVTSDTSNMDTTTSECQTKSNKTQKTEKAPETDTDRCDEQTKTQGAPQTDRCDEQTDTQGAPQSATDKSTEQTAQKVVAVLPGLGEYTEYTDTSDSESSSSDSDIETDCFKKVVYVHIQQT